MAAEHASRGGVRVSVASRSPGGGAGLRGAGAVLLPLLLLSSCAPLSSPAARAPGPDARLATRDEIVDSRLANLLEFVRWHRPQWIRYSAADGWGHSGVAVYLNGAWIGNEESLRDISSGFAASLRYIEGDEASARWGRGHGAGAIMITSLPALRATAALARQPAPPSR
jgi:hypothetical protein